MFLLILTLTLCLTKALVRENFEVTTPPDYSNDPIYNVNGWINQLQLQRCALVAIGLKYFAIFVEDEIFGKRRLNVRNKFFVGICPQEVLEEWRFCSPDLAKKRKNKCRFKLKNDRFQPRVHRRFCDFKVIVRNKDCKCAPTIFGEPLMKASVASFNCMVTSRLLTTLSVCRVSRDISLSCVSRTSRTLLPIHNDVNVNGLPTCYIPPLPSSLCKYNVCGLNQCTPVTVEDRIHTVNCSSKCEGKYPFCEHPTERTSRPPAPWSSWSKWRRVAAGKSPDDAAAAVAEPSLATCINKYKRRDGGGGGLDCLGPGTGCCPRGANNCTCDTFEEEGTLKVQRIIYPHQEERSRRSLSYYPSYVPPETSYIFRFLRDTKKDDEDDLDDDEDDEGDLDEDIVLEDNPDDEKPIPTTEELEKEEVVEESKHNAVEEIKNETNPSVPKNNCQNVIFRGIYLRMMMVASSWALVLTFML